VGAHLVHQILSAFRDSFIPPVREQVGPNIEDVAKISYAALARASLGRGSIDEGGNGIGHFSAPQQQNGSAAHANRTFRWAEPQFR